ncbi:MAG TPA: hypothetical protein VFV33_23425 [Gemmatimonadaceae bacterium]|nr:hypothetical protein [Gemmatimonadaceae bacterium]
MTRPRARRVRPIAALALGLLLTAGAASQAPAQAPQARALLPGVDGAILLDTLGLPFPIHGSRDSIFVALERVFAELKIPVETRDPRKGLLHNLNADVSKRIGNVPLSRYLDCGRGFSGDNANFYQVTLAISAWVDPPTGEPRLLQVAIAASGRDPAGSRTGWVQCTSKGSLEKLVADKVQTLVSHTP